MFGLITLGAVALWGFVARVLYMFLETPDLSDLHLAYIVAWPFSPAIWLVVRGARAADALGTRLKARAARRALPRAEIREPREP